MGRSGCVGGLLENVPLICGGCRGGSGEGRFINQFSYFIYGLNGPFGTSSAAHCWHLSLWYIMKVFHNVLKFENMHKK